LDLLLRSPKIKLALEPDVDNDYLIMIAQNTLTVSAAIAFSTFPVVPEDCVFPFNFYLNEQVHQGILYFNELYGLVREFKTHQRLTAYQSILDLIEQGNGVLMTVSSSHYRSWINLRSPDCLHHF
jgi:hypothetical protein